jgi:outer membrane protein assembly factor BamB
MNNLVMCLIVFFAWTHCAVANISALAHRSGVQGGLIVHVGCGDGEQTATLRIDDRFLVFGLDTERIQINRARAHIQSLGLYGPVTVDAFDGKYLPLIDNTVNLLVARELGDLPLAEVMRVLTPEGIAMIGSQKHVKTRPREIDEWTHYLHDADNNAVANDTVVGPPRALQWQAEPKWPRHHDKMSSFSALVSTGGRIFYIIDEGSTASIFMPSHWALIARDAFNGKLLWKKPIATWYSRYKGLKDGPADAPRRLVASGDRVYATLNLDGVLSAIDTITGDTILEYEGTEGTEEVLVSDGVVYVLMGAHSLGDGSRKFRPVEKRTIKALDATSGRMLWEHTDVVAALTMAVNKRHLCYFNFDSKQVVCLDRKTGQRAWVSDDLPSPKKQMSYFASKLVLHDDVVLFAGGEHSGMTKSGGGETRSDTLSALNAVTGKTLWVDKHPPSGYSSPENLFVIGNTVWCDSSSNGKLNGAVIGYDLYTGEVKHRFPEDQTNYWFHHRCYPGRATQNFIMTSRTGIEFIDLAQEHWDINHWVRGACLYGIMPCNGLVYAPPAPCACYAETYLHSFNALSNGATVAPYTIKPVSKRLKKGPAYDQMIQGEVSVSDWPTYRYDNARRAYTKATVQPRLSTRWVADLGGTLSSVTVAEDKVFVATVDTHTVHALNANTGKPVWQFTTGGRVDSPPTYYKGRVLFGSADGRVYCVCARDGRLVWRFEAALSDRRFVSYEQMESLWPVHGAVLVQDGIAHFVAGRSLFVDGGMRYYRLDAKTGQCLSDTVLDDRHPQTGQAMQELVKWLNMPVGRPDILSCDGARVYMRSQAFDLQGKRLRMGPTLANRNEGKRQGGAETHLFCPTGYLDDTWFHRTYWLYGKTWGSGWNGYYVAGQYAPAGKIMSVSDERVYGFGRQPQYYRWTAPLEFRLFASQKQWHASQTQLTSNNKNERGPIYNQANYPWVTQVPILVRAMALADNTLFVAGPRDVFDESSSNARDQEDLILKQEAALSGQSGAVLWAVSAETGETLSEYTLDAPPVFDGMVAAKQSIFLSTADGKVHCLTGLE